MSFVVPNLDNDMHDGTIAQGDTWLQNNLDGYVTWAKTHNSVFVLTFDEDDGSQANQIPTIFTGQRRADRRVRSTLNHYNLLRTSRTRTASPRSAPARRPPRSSTSGRRRR